MKLYWSIDEIPELSGLLPKQKKQALQFCMRKYAFRLWQLWLCVLVIASLSIAARLIFQFNGTIADAIVGGICGMAGWLISINALRPQLRDYVRKNFTNP
jgi:uncharacterized membrane protein (DUF4010 family)